VRRRLLLSYLTITAVTLCVLVYPLGRTFASRERDRLLRDIEHDATVVVNLAEDGLEQGTRPPIDALLARYRDDPGGRIVVVDARGRTVADSDHPGEAGVDFSNRPEIAKAIEGRRAEGSRPSTTLGHDLVYVALPVASSGIVHGAVRITYPSSTLDARVRDVWLRLIALSAVVLAVVTVVGFALARSVTRPVERLKAAAHAFAAGDLTARAPTDDGAPELRELGEVFNATAARLDELLVEQQAFVADASHQLRTPLAALRLRLENLESDAPPELQPRLAAARAETARLSRLSEALLALARAAGSVRVAEAIDVSTVATERVDAWSSMADDLGVRLVVEASSRAGALAVPGAVEQILDNLLDNALEVAPEDSEVRVQVSRRGRDVELHVLDEGPGLDEAHRRHAFDRFWRGPGAEPGGTGLGLAIVARLAEASGGRAGLDPRQDGGLDAWVALPSTTLR
jgi:signal transduction histidine kinase